MLRFDQLVHSRMSIREIRAQHPETISVFDELGFRSCCDDCSIEVAARRQEIAPAAVIDRLNQAVQREGNRTV